MHSLRARRWRRSGGLGFIDLEQAVALLARHGAMEDTRREALDWAEKAKAALAALPAHELKDMLSDLADYVVARVK